MLVLPRLLLLLLLLLQSTVYLRVAVTSTSIKATRVRQVLRWSILLFSLLSKGKKIRANRVVTYASFMMIEPAALFIRPVACQTWQPSAKSFVTDDRMVERRHLYVAITIEVRRDRRILTKMTVPIVVFLSNLG